MLKLLLTAAAAAAVCVTVTVGVVLALLDIWAQADSLGRQLFTLAVVLVIALGALYVLFSSSPPRQ